MTARNETLALMQRFGSRNINLSFDDANALRRAQITLHRWAELECGTGDGHIERSESTGKPYYYNARARFVNPSDPRARHAIPDREAGALKRIAEICQRNALHYFHQTDPRGCSLYVSNAPLSDSAYTNGIACC